MVRAIAVWYETAREMHRPKTLNYTSNDQIIVGVWPPSHYAACGVVLRLIPPSRPCHSLASDYVVVVVVPLLGKMLFELAGVRHNMLRTGRPAARILRVCLVVLAATDGASNGRSARSVRSAISRCLVRGSNLALHCTSTCWRRARRRQASVGSRVVTGVFSPRRSSFGRNGTSHAPGRRASLP